MDTKYIFQLFDSRNTCTEQQIPLARTAMQASEVARRLSIKHHHVIVNDEHGAFETFEKGERTEWSYPNGLGQIKINQ